VISFDAGPSPAPLIATTVTKYVPDGASVENDVAPTGSTATGGPPGETRAINR
jgi:hypothetical protein